MLGREMWNPIGPRLELVRDPATAATCGAATAPLGAALPGPLW
jgi:hypothetical protein